MNESPHRSAGRPDEELPRRLITALKATYPSGSEVPPETNASILAESRSRLQVIARSEERGRRSALVSGASSVVQPARFAIATFSAWWSRPSVHRPLATAAALLLFLTLRIGLDERLGPRQQVERPTIAREDLDGNGRVDIADAYLLARVLDGAAPGRGEWDINADGVVGMADVEAIARRAVNLSRSRHP